MDAKDLVSLMRGGASLSCLEEYALHAGDDVIEISPRTAAAAIRSGMIEQVCNSGSPVLRFRLTEAAQEENEP